jgi:ELWxxDGT repeat protein
VDFICVFFALLVVLLPGESSAAGPAYLVKDINTGPDPEATSAISDVVTTGNVAYFTASDRIHGREVWKTDGTPAGTVLVRDLNPGHPDGLQTNLSGSARTGARLALVDETLFFAGTDGRDESIALWKTDGTANGTMLLKDIDAMWLTGVGSTLFFMVNDPDLGAQLWKSDGTSAGTVLVKQFAAPAVSAALTDVSGTLFLVANDGTHGDELWKSDGTAAGTVLVKDIAEGAGTPFDGPAQLFNVDGTLFFLASEAGTGAELWRSDGTAAGTGRVKDIRPGPESAFHINLHNDDALNYLPLFASVGGALLFVANDGISGFELWRSDGTEAGTVPLKDINPGPDDAFALDGPDYGPVSATVDGAFFFVAADGVHGLGLWRSDGTVAGTTLLRSIVPSSDGPPVFGLVGSGDTLFFATYGGDGSELWRSDGTTAGTVVVTSSQTTSFNPLAAVHGGVLMRGSSRTTGLEPWWSDGTAAGTYLLRDILPGNGGSFPDHLTDVNGTLFFTATDGIHGVELWRSDATDAGTFMTTDIRPGADDSAPDHLTAVNGTLFFTADDGGSGVELWRSDGTMGGTLRVKDINPGPNGSAPEQLTAVGSTVFFFADDGVHGSELWKSDGTEAGTIMVRDINPGPFGSGDYEQWAAAYTPKQPANVNGTLFFAADDTGEIPGFGRNVELWRSDGTEAGTVKVAELAPPPQGSYPALLTAVNDVLYFQTLSPSQRQHLWKSDGTAPGTVELVSRETDSLTDANGLLFFTAASDDQNLQLWRSDGSASGTMPVTHFDEGPSIGDVVAVDGYVFFIGGTVWRSNGTWPGTSPLTAEAYDVANLTSDGAHVIFTARSNTSTWGALWTTDGTEMGTGQIHDLTPDLDRGYISVVSFPSFTFSGSHVFFINDQQGAGHELWALPVSALPEVCTSGCPAVPTPPPTPTPTTTPTASPTPPCGSPQDRSACTHISIGSADGHAGDVVTVQVTLHALGQPVAGVQSDIAFDLQTPISARADGVPDCAVNADIHKDATAFAFQPPGCTYGTDCTGFRALVLATDNIDPIADGSLLYTCTVHIASDALPGTYGVRLSGIIVADPQGDPFSAKGANGTIRVLGSADAVAAAAPPQATTRGGCQMLPASEPLIGWGALLPAVALLVVLLRRSRC